MSPTSLFFLMLDKTLCWSLRWYLAQNPHSLHCPWSCSEVTHLAPKRTLYSAMVDELSMWRRNPGSSICERSSVHFQSTLPPTKFYQLWSTQRRWHTISATPNVSPSHSQEGGINRCPGRSSWSIATSPSPGQYMFFILILWAGHQE